MHSRVASYFALALLTLYSSVLANAPEALRHGNSSKVRVPKLGAVASESAVCSRIGTNLLEQGGNAADAVRAERIFHAHSRRLIEFEAGWYTVLCRCNW